MTKMPDALRVHQDAIASALLVHSLQTWDEEETYADADQPAAIGRALVRALHPHLANAKIGYLYREEIKSRGTTVWAQASKVGGKLKYFSHLDFLIEVNWMTWNRLQPPRRVALIDHELTHCGIEDTEQGPRCVIVPHDIEEFESIVRRWGVWRPSLASFASALGEGQQTGLFPHD